MIRKKELEEVLTTLRNHERRICTLEDKKETKQTSYKSTWYRPGSTVDKIMEFIKGKFFSVPRSISEIISELEAKDYHLKASDLTLPLRKIVRRNILKRTKKKNDGSSSKTWLYVEK